MYRDNTGTDRDLTGPTTLNEGQWYHIAGTFEESGGSTIVTIAIDGLTDIQQTLTGTIDYTAVSNLYIGSNYDGEPVANIGTREF